MSTHTQKLIAPTVRLPESESCTFANDLSRIGAPPLNSIFVAVAMECAALGLPPEATKWQLRTRRMFRSPENWEITSLAEYLTEGEARERQGMHPAYGWPMPKEVLDRARLAERLPGTTIRVHALLSDDPYVFAVRGHEVEPIGGWYGRNEYRRIFLG